MQLSCINASRSTTRDSAHTRLPDRSRGNLSVAPALYSTRAGTQHDVIIRSLRAHLTCSQWTPAHMRLHTTSHLPTLREALARPRKSWTAGSHAPPHSARPSAASPPPAARSMAASRRLALLLPRRLRTAFGIAGASLSAATAAAAAELLGTAAAMLDAEEWIPVRVERGHSIAARAASA